MAPTRTSTDLYYPTAPADVLLDTTTRLKSEDLAAILPGITVATKTTPEDIKSFSDFLQDNPKGATLYEWSNILQESFKYQPEITVHLARLTLAVSYMRLKSRLNSFVNTPDLSFIWTILYTTLTSPLSTTLFHPIRSAQGFLAVPLCSIIKSGNISELFRFHVWLPDHQRGNHEIGIHAHQPWAQTWILAGGSTNFSYTVEAVSDPDLASHAEYALSWDDGVVSGRSYATHQKMSSLKKTDKLVRARVVSEEIQKKGMSYVIGANCYHASKVEGDKVNATLFFFDGEREFWREARVLGPKEGEAYSQVRDPAGITAGELAEVVERVRME